MRYSSRADDQRRWMTPPDLDRAGMSGSILPVPQVRDEERFYLPTPFSSTGVCSLEGMIRADRKAAA